MVQFVTLRKDIINSAWFVSGAIQDDGTFWIGLHDRISMSHSGSMDRLAAMNAEGEYVIEERDGRQAIAIQVRMYSRSGHAGIATYRAPGTPLKNTWRRLVIANPNHVFAYGKFSE